MVLVRNVLAGVVLVTVGFSVGARADDDDYDAFMKDCTRTDLSTSDLADCMERARVMAETRPSPQLQALIAHLERESDGIADPDKPAQTQATATSSPKSSQRATATQSPIVADGAPAKVDEADDAAPTEIEAPDDSESAEKSPDSFEGDGIPVPQEPPHG